MVMSFMILPWRPELVFIGTSAMGSIQVTGSFAAVWRADLNKSSDASSSAFKQFQCQLSSWVMKVSSIIKYEHKKMEVLHPEIVFFNPLHSEEKNAILCYDVRTEELELFAKLEGKPDVYRLQVFQPMVSCWATPIPRYEALRGMYDGSYSFWVQSTSESKSPLLNICKFMKSTFYKDYMKNVTEEATLDMLAEIIQRRKKKISEIKEEVTCKTLAELLYPPVSIESVCTRNMVVPSRKRKLGGMVITERKQPRFVDDKEAGFKDVVSYVAAVGNPKEVEQGLMCETEQLPVQHPNFENFVSNWQWNTHTHLFPDDKEADFEDDDSYMAALVKWKELKHGFYIETWAEIPHPFGGRTLEDQGKAMLACYFGKGRLMFKDVVG
uniref:Uncharacterized protein n=1 Tax=Linum usitatissimum TaxID=4006 RepID=A0A165G0E1_LINUS|nr:hypothetical protein [Linum usitatissimum]